MTDLSIIIPVYNEEPNIKTLLSRLHGVLDKMQIKVELLFVNDGSTDNTIHLIKESAVADASVKYIDFSRNFGHQVAVSAGLDHCSGKAVVIIDADLQDPPELIETLYKKYKEGFEVVYARRLNRSGEGALKKLTARYFYRLLQQITTISIPVDTGDFRIIDRKVVDILKQMPEREKYLRGQIAWVGFNQTYIEYNREARNAGNTGYTYRKMLRFALDGITSFSNFPLKFATIMGFTVSLISFFVMLYALYSRFISHSYVAGWASLMLSVLFIGGVQLICVGIIGEYISRISANVRNRPLYVVKEMLLDSSQRS